MVKSTMSSDMWVIFQNVLFLTDENMVTTPVGYKHGNNETTVYYSFSCLVRR